MATTVPLYGAPGFRFLKDLYPSGREGGLNYYPYSSIFKGLDLSLNFAPAAPVSPNALGTFSVGISAGSAYLDSIMSNLSQAITLIIDPKASLGGANPVDGLNQYNIYLNPTRKLQPIALGAPNPTTRLNGDPVDDGDCVAVSVDEGEEFVTKSFRMLKGGVWTEFDPTFSSPPVYAQRGRNRDFGNDAYSKLTLSNVSVNAVEKEIFVGTKYPNYTNSNSKAKLRASASLLLGTLKLWYHVLPMPIIGTLNSSTSLVVHPDYVSSVNAVVTSAGNANLLKVTGNAGVGAGDIAANGWNRTTRTLTLAAAATVNLINTPLMINPATAGNNWLLNPFKSEVVGSGNYTNP